MKRHDLTALAKDFPSPKKQKPRCPATTTDLGNATRCFLPAGHKAMHDDGAILWGSRKPARKYPDRSWRVQGDERGFDELFVNSLSIHLEMMNSRTCDVHLGDVHLTVWLDRGFVRVRYVEPGDRPLEYNEEVSR
jgi:hypothetical protein